MLGTRILRSYFTDVIPDDAEELTYMVMERRFMLTKNGYLGWAPDNGREPNQTRVGDSIAIIYGYSTPLVIRPYEDKFQVVGEAHVEGFMDGEAVGLLHRDDYQTKTFSFC
jgi:hypothetical protein